MDIKLFADDKEIITPLFEFKIKDTRKQILTLCIKNNSIQEKEKFLSIINNLTLNNLYINSDYIAVTTEKEIYFFGLSNYSNYKFENTLISGYYDFMFAFIDNDDKIIMESKAMKLNGLQFKQL